MIHFPSKSLHLPRCQLVRSMKFSLYCFGILTVKVFLVGYEVTRRGSTFSCFSVNEFLAFGSPIKNDKLPPPSSKKPMTMKPHRPESKKRKLIPSSSHDVFLGLTLMEIRKNLINLTQNVSGSLFYKFHCLPQNLTFFHCSLPLKKIRL